MHICYVAFAKIPSRLPDSIQVMKMCQAMAQRDYEVTLIVPATTRWLEGNLDSLWHHYGVEQRFPIHTLPFDAVPRKLRPHLFGWRAVQHARGLGADLVYTRLPPAAVFAAHQGVSTIYETHQVERGVTVRPYLRLMRKGAGFLHFVILTQGLKSDLLQTYPSVFSGAKMVLAPDGVDLERFYDLPDPQNARNRLGLGLGKELVAGYAGGFVPGKGVELIHMLASRHPQITFLLMGGEPEAVAAHRQQVERDGLRNVILTGFVANAELPMYLAACDVLLLPNQRAVEKRFGATYNFAHWTSPMKLFEYMAAGRMIIASDLPVLREVLHDENALLCPPDDLDSWQRALLRSVVDKVSRQALASQARREVAGYTWTNRVVRCLDDLA